MRVDRALCRAMFRSCPRKFSGPLSAIVRRSARSTRTFDASRYHSFFSIEMRHFSRPMKFLVQLALFPFLAVAAQAQIQVELKFKRLQYVASEPVMATVKITNLAGRDIDLHDENGQHWFGFAVNAIAYDEPQAELDCANQLHVLHCAAPRSWAYSYIGLNGELLAHSTFMETKTRPRLRHAVDGAIAKRGGRLDLPIAHLRGAPPRNCRPGRPVCPRTIKICGPPFQ
jgi:hypothetical protein